MRVFALGSVVATARFLGGLLLYLISPLNELDGGEVGTRVGLIVNLLPAAVGLSRPPSRRLRPAAVAAELLNLVSPYS